jgi:hypothetical protein
MAGVVNRALPAAPRTRRKPRRDKGVAAEVVIIVFSPLV